MRINLAGYSLRSTVADAAVTLSGAGVFRVDGGYNALGECGTLVSAGASEFLQYRRR